MLNHFLHSDYGMTRFDVYVRFMDTPIGSSITTKENHRVP